MAECFEIKNGLCSIHLKVIPGASKNEICDVKNGRLRVRIAAAPEDGKANAALTNFLAKKLNLSKNAVSITSGEKSRLKTISFSAQNQYNTEFFIPD